MAEVCRIDIVVLELSGLTVPTVRNVTYETSGIVSTTVPHEVVDHEHLCDFACVTENDKSLVQFPVKGFQL